MTVNRLGDMGRERVVPVRPIGGSLCFPNSLTLEKSVVGKLVDRTLDFMGKTRNARELYPWEPISFWSENPGEKAEAVLDELPRNIRSVIVIEDRRGARDLLVDSLKWSLGAHNLNPGVYLLDRGVVRDSGKFVVFCARGITGFEKIEEVAAKFGPSLIFMDYNLKAEPNYNGEILTANISVTSPHKHIIVPMSNSAEGNYKIIKMGGTFVLNRTNFIRTIPTLFAQAVK